MTQWIVWEIASCSFECFLFFFVLSHFLPLKAATAVPSLLGTVALAAFEISSAQMELPYALSFCVSAAADLAYCFAFFSGSRTQRALWPLVWAACRAFTLLLAAILLSAVPNANPGAAALRTPEGIGVELFCLAALSLLAWGLTRLPLRTPRRWAGKVHVAALAVLVLGVVASAQIAALGFTDSGFTGVLAPVRTLALCVGGVMLLCAAILDTGSRLAWTKDAAEERACGAEAELASVRYAQDLICTWKHDFGQMLSVMRSLAAQGNVHELEKYIGEVGDLYGEDLLGASTGDIGIDALLQAKVKAARKVGIPVSCTLGVIGAYVRFRAELSVILGNLLDNALEACSKVPSEKRFLSLLVSSSSDGLVIRVVNASDGAYAQSGTKLYSTKSSSGHGYGFRRTEQQIRRIGGALRMHPGESTFEVSVYFPPVAPDTAARASSSLNRKENKHA